MISTVRTDLNNGLVLKAEMQGYVNNEKIDAVVPKHWKHCTRELSKRVFVLNMIMPLVKSMPCNEWRMYGDDVICKAVRSAVSAQCEPQSGDLRPRGKAGRSQQSQWWCVASSCSWFFVHCGRQQLFKTSNCNYKKIYVMSNCCLFFFYPLWCFLEVKEP